MKKIYALKDYKGLFGSKHNAIPYNSGMDKNFLSDYFLKHQIEIEYIFFADVISYSASFWKDKIVIYTSSEDPEYQYKSFIEDVIYYLELIGANVVPSFKYLRANNNKVFMELLRYSFDISEISVSTKVFGSFEEMKNSLSAFTYPLVYKQSEGAMSKGVGSADNSIELTNKVKKIAWSKHFFKELWELGRVLKHKNYIPHSKYRKKFIVQNFIDDLNGDYKVLVFGDKYYVLKRDTKTNDFRASGSGIRKYTKEIPKGILRYAKLCMDILKVPHASLDIAFDGKIFFLIEFQCLYFGSYTLTYSDFYWYRTQQDEFVLTEGKSILEEEYANSIINFVFSDTLN